MMSLRINFERRGLKLRPAGMGDGAALFDHTPSICYTRSEKHRLLVQMIMPFRYYISNRPVRHVRRDGRITVEPLVFSSLADSSRRIGSVLWGSLVLSISNPV